MSLLAVIAAILNMAGAMASLPVWARIAMILVNLAFVALGLAWGETLAWGTHLALLPLNATLLVGEVRGRSA